MCLLPSHCSIFSLEYLLWGELGFVGLGVSFRGIFRRNVRVQKQV